MSVPEWWDTHRAETNERYFDFKYVELCTHVDILFLFLYGLYSTAIPIRLSSFVLKYYVYAVGARLIYKGSSLVTKQCFFFMTLSCGFY
jgi:hypothetical protein